MGGKRSDIVYAVKSYEIKYPPIIIEVQQTVNEQFIHRAISYCLSAYDKYKVNPIVLVFSLNPVPVSTFTKFKTCQEYPFMLKTDASHFAHGFYLVSKSNSLGYIKELNNENMNMIAVLSIFFCSKERSLANVDEWNNRHMVFLYSLAMEISQGWKESNSSQVEALYTICCASQERFEKIKEITSGDKNKAAKLCEAGAEYHRRLKRKYEKLLLDESEEEDTMEQPEEVTIVQVYKRKAKKVPLSKDELAYITTFKNQTTNRTDWVCCLEKGRKEHKYFQSITTAESLRATYNRNKVMSQKSN